LGYKSLDLLE
jgi:hypothetical protein